MYMADLRELDRCVPLEPRVIPPSLEVVVTPLQLVVWSSELWAHPDVEFAQFIFVIISDFEILVTHCSAHFA